MGTANALPAVVFSFLVVAAAAATYDFPVRVSGKKVYDGFILDGENLAPLADGLLKFSPLASGPAALPPDAGFPLVLAAGRTRRPDVLDKFRTYKGGWDINNKHYWTSVGFTGAAGFILALLWLLSFVIALASYNCCKWRMIVKERRSAGSEQRICLMLLLLFTCAASIGCILLSIGQDEFHDEVLDTLSFVVNQSDFTVQILRNVTDYLSIAKTISVDQFYISSKVQNEIDKLDVDLISAADTVSHKTADSSEKIRRAINNVRAVLILIAVLMLLLSIIGFVLSNLGYKHAIYVFITSGWLLVAVTLVLCGIFVILNNVVGDTCNAMDEWVSYPQAETALSNILPCVDQQTTNQTLYQSKEVILQLVSLVNSVIRSIANSNTGSHGSYFFNQSGSLMPRLCSPYNSNLRSRNCQPDEVSFSNASLVWENYICVVSSSGACTSVGRITPTMYMQLVTAVNASFALDHYTPLLLSLQDCNFVRETFNAITAHFCPHLRRDLRVVNAGLVTISISIVLCLILWIFYANRPRREDEFVNMSEVKCSSDATSQ
ncbi:hypothetical protein AXF42_Ash005397 [Apostasia shenzhenica]|uniref:Uncharacterized protein n=1 Tax=Apostasia shenzhenica TaxID=1088818 RepID=A0A2I0B6U4_9ASPA|nr:hypothetical protein AXF42_Ash005397 [Apostasia shenzhenica]